MGDRDQGQTSPVITQQVCSDGAGPMSSQNAQPVVKVKVRAVAVQDHRRYSCKAAVENRFGPAVKPQLKSSSQRIGGAGHCF